MASTRDKARSNLKRLYRKPATIGEIKTIFTDLRAESNDRAIALIAGATVDDVLTRALLVPLGKLNSDERSKLFDPEMPLGSFGARIKMAYALRLGSQ